jgi:AraC family transcriptional regulator, regulatory protein of adaptative response / DNA-3-methyladenine glycosylase II
MKPEQALLATDVASAWVETDMSYLLPFDWAGLLEFLALRVIEGVERVDLGQLQYYRYMAMAHQGRRLVGEIRVRNCAQRNVLLVAISPPLQPVKLQILTRLRDVFDLDLEPDRVKFALGALCVNPGLRLPGGFSGFEIAVRAVLGQQVSVKGAHTLAARIAARFGRDQCFPEPSEIAVLQASELRACGLIQSRSQCLLDLAAALNGGSLSLDRSEPIAQTIDALKQIKGIGDWTAQYVAMRALRCVDALPANDLVLKKKLGFQSAKEVTQAFERYRPWRAYAVIHTWKLP